MTSKRVIILAGHRRSLATVAMLRALAGQPAARIVAVVCAREWSLKRLRHWQRRFGKGLVRRIACELGLGRGWGNRDLERETYVHRVAPDGERLPTVPDICSELGAAFHVVPSINSDAALALVDRHGAHVAIYTGGGILRKPMIERLPDGVLNVHCGPLPAIRGMNAVEWSLFHGLCPTATVHRIDAGIDTGEIYVARSVAVERGEPLGVLRARTVLAGIDLLAESFGDILAGRLSLQTNPASDGRQYFEMAEPLRALVQSWVDMGLTPVAETDAMAPADWRVSPLRTDSH